MPYGYSPQCQVVLWRWNDGYAQAKWDRIRSHVSSHKQAYQVYGSVKEDRGNYYSYIIGEYGKVGA